MPPHECFRNTSNSVCAKPVSFSSACSNSQVSFCPSQDQRLAPTYTHCLRHKPRSHLWWLLSCFLLFNQPLGFVNSTFVTFTESVLSSPELPKLSPHHFACVLMSNGLPGWLWPILPPTHLSCPGYGTLECIKLDPITVLRFFKMVPYCCSDQDQAFSWSDSW